MLSSIKTKSLNYSTYSRKYIALRSHAANPPSPTFPVPSLYEE